MERLSFMNIHAKWKIEGTDDANIWPTFCYGSIEILLISELFNHRFAWQDCVHVSTCKLSIRKFKRKLNLDGRSFDFKFSFRINIEKSKFSIIRNSGKAPSNSAKVVSCNNTFIFSGLCFDFYTTSTILALDSLVSSWKRSPWSKIMPRRGVTEFPWTLSN